MVVITVYKSKCGVCTKECFELESENTYCPHCGAKGSNLKHEGAQRRATVKVNPVTGSIWVYEDSKEPAEYMQVIGE